VLGRLPSVDEKLLRLCRASSDGFPDSLNPELLGANRGRMTLPPPTGPPVPAPAAEELDVGLFFLKLLDALDVFDAVLPLLGLPLPVSSEPCSSTTTSGVGVVLRELVREWDCCASDERIELPLSLMRRSPRSAAFTLLSCL
jgi:hypothetical protein